MDTDKKENSRVRFSGLKSSFANETFMNGFLTTENAASLLNCTEQYVRKLIRTGQVPASRHGRTWLIPEETLHAHRMKTDLDNSSVSDHARTLQPKRKLKALLYFPVRFACNSANFRVP